MSKNFEAGKARGTWTDEQLAQVSSTPTELLALAEATFQGELENLKRLSPDLAEKHAEYLSGYLTGVRESLSRKTRGAEA